MIMKGEELLDIFIEASQQDAKIGVSENNSTMSL